MKIKLDKGTKMPTRAHSTDAGLDLYARDTQIIPAKESAVFDTGVHVELPEGTAGFLKSKSGLNTKHGKRRCDRCGIYREHRGQAVQPQRQGLQGQGRGQDHAAGDRADFNA